LIKHLLLLRGEHGAHLQHVQNGFPLQLAHGPLQVFERPLGGGAQRHLVGQGFAELGVGRADLGAQAVTLMGVAALGFRSWWTI
jgi:hypothetical protein